MKKTTGRHPTFPVMAPLPIPTPEEVRVRNKADLDNFREEFEQFLRKHGAMCEWAQLRVHGKVVVYSQ